MQEKIAEVPKIETQEEAFEAHQTEMKVKESLEMQASIRAKHDPLVKVKESLEVQASIHSEDDQFAKRKESQEMQANFHAEDPFVKVKESLEMQASIHAEEDPFVKAKESMEMQVSIHAEDDPVAQPQVLDMRKEINTPSSSDAMARDTTPGQTREFDAQPRVQDIPIEIKGACFSTDIPVPVSDMPALLSFPFGMADGSSSSVGFQEDNMSTQDDDEWMHSSVALSALSVMTELCVTLREMEPFDFEPVATAIRGLMQDLKSQQCIRRERVESIVAALLGWKRRQ